MLRRASVAEVKAGKVTRADGHLVVAMRVYPRFLARSLVSEYVHALSPEAGLFADYRRHKQASGDQNAAFEAAGYQRRFVLDEAGLAELERLADRARSGDVYVVCQCSPDEHCHVDLLLLLAERHFGAAIGPLADPYPEFRRQLGPPRASTGDRAGPTATR